MMELAVRDAAAQSGATFEDTWASAKSLAPTLTEACPHLDDFAKAFKNVDAANQEKLMTLMSPYGMLFQCTNFFATADALKFLGFSDTDVDGIHGSKLLLLHGESLFAACEKIFGDAVQEEKKMEKHLAEMEGKVGPAARSFDLRSMLTKLNKLMSKK